MSKLRVHAFTISLDGYGAGPNQDLQNPLGVGGESACTNGSSRPARSRSISAGTAARPAPTTISPRAASRTSARGSSAATCSARSAAHGRTTPGRAGGATTRPTTSRCSCSRTTRARRSPWTAARRSISSPTASRPRSGARARPRTARTCASAAAWRRSGNICRRGWSTRCMSRSRRCCSAAARRLFAGLDLPALGYERTEHVPTAKATHVVIKKRG